MVRSDAACEGDAMNQMVGDVRYALRQLRKSPGFAVTAVLTLGLGIGATTTMYSVVRDTLLAPLPYPEHERLVGVAWTFPEETANAEETGAGAEFVMAHSRSFEALGVSEDSSLRANLSSGNGKGGNLDVASTKVSHGYFSTLGVQPVIGRNFTAEEDLPHGAKVALLSYGVWQRTFGGDAGIVNRVVRINEEPYTVVGVMPEGVSGSPSTQGGAASEGVWLPLQLSSKDPGYDGDNYVMTGRLRPGVSLQQAQEDLNGLNAPFYAQFPKFTKWNHGKLLHKFLAQPLQTVLVSDVRQSLLVLFGAVLAVLLVACLNLAGLMTARASTRERELALRTALGATRGRILRLLMCESVVLAVAGGGLGLVLARVARPILLAASPLAIPLQTREGYWGIVAFVMGVSLVTTLVCGLLPAWTVFRRSAQAALAGGQATGASVSQVRLGKSLMVGQVAVAMVLLSASSLLLGSFLKLRGTPSGVVAKRLEIAQVSLKGAGYETTKHTTQFIDKVIAGLGSYPGVQQVAAVNGLPLDRGLNIGGAPTGRPELEQTVEFRVVSPGYFRTLGVPLMMGRDVTADDGAGAPNVAVVSEAAARKWWPGKSPIGDQVAVGKTNMTVVGVVADTRAHSLAEPPTVMIYVPFAQLPDDMTKVVNGWFSTTFAIRMSGDMDMAAAVQKAVSDADPEMPVAKLTPMQEVIDDTVAAPRFFSWMAGGFAGFALLLTVVGLFGLLSYQVTQRTREIGVRLAVGSSRTGILLLILRRGLVLTAMGSAIGGVASLGVPKLVASVLADSVYTGGGVGSLLSSSVAALGLAAVAMLVAAMLASYLPARRAAAVEPMEALRAE
jgi:predicted permease